MFVTIASFIFVLGVLVFVHEAGHFAAAKLAGIRVIRFAFGFGKVLFGIKWRGTEYAVALLPLGGYVKMAGGDERERTGAADEFLSKPPWVRMLVAVAGPAMNIVLAVAVYAVVAKAGYTLYTFPNRVGRVLETVALADGGVAAPARAAGFRAGDVVVAVNGRPTPYWVDLQREVNVSAGRALTFDVRRAGRELSLTARPALDPETGRGLVGLMPYQGSEVFAVAAGSAAAAAGVAQGDKLVALDGRPVASFTELLAAAGELAPGRHTVTFASPGGEKAVVVEYAGPGGEDAFIEAFGVVCGMVTVKRASSWLGAVPAGWRQTWDVTVVTARGLALVVRGRVKVTKALGGPITIARVAGETARAGVVTFLAYLGYLSVMVGMLNLLPVPVLDGGHIVIGAVESVRRRNLSARARELVNVVGFVFLIGIVALALFADVSRLFAGRS